MDRKRLLVSLDFIPFPLIDIVFAYEFGSPFRTRKNARKFSIAGELLNCSFGSDGVFQVQGVIRARGVYGVQRLNPGFPPDDAVPWYFEASQKLSQPRWRVTRSFEDGTQDSILILPYSDFSTACPMMGDYMHGDHAYQLREEEHPGSSRKKSEYEAWYKQTSEYLLNELGMGVFPVFAEMSKMRALKEDQLLLTDNKSGGRESNKS